jgi:hypothetical protein
MTVIKIINEKIIKFLFFFVLHFYRNYLIISPAVISKLWTIIYYTHSQGSTSGGHGQFTDSHLTDAKAWNLSLESFSFILITIKSNKRFPVRKKYKYSFKPYS